MQVYGLHPGLTSKSMHREVKIKHDWMTRKYKYTLMAWDTKWAVCVRKQTVFISFLPLVNSHVQLIWRHRRFGQVSSLVLSFSITLSFTIFSLCGPKWDNGSKYFSLDFESWYWRYYHQLLYNFLCSCYWLTVQTDSQLNRTTVRSIAMKNMLSWVEWL